MLVDIIGPTDTNPGQAIVLSDVTEPRYCRFSLDQLCSSRLLDHSMVLNKRVDDVPAGHASPPFHPHRNTALAQIDQAIGHHEAVASCAVHGILLC